jgi:hypothetical protein
LSAQVPPLELRSPVPHEVTDTMHAAMKAALADDFRALDRLELDFLNILVRIGELAIREADGTPHYWCVPVEDAAAPFVVGIHRGYTPAGRTALEWSLAEKCRRCAGSLRHDAECRVCSGSWYVDDASDHPTLYTDLEGVLIEEVQ